MFWRGNEGQSVRISVLLNEPFKITFHVLRIDWTSIRFPILKALRSISVYFLRKMLRKALK